MHSINNFMKIIAEYKILIQHCLFYMIKSEKICEANAGQWINECYGKDAVAASRYQEWFAMFFK